MQKHISENILWIKFQIYIQLDKQNVLSSTVRKMYFIF